MRFPTRQKQTTPALSASAALTFLTAPSERRHSSGEWINHTGAYLVLLLPPTLGTSTLPRPLVLLPVAISVKSKLIRMEILLRNHVKTPTDIGSVPGKCWARGARPVPSSSGTTHALRAAVSYGTRLGSEAGGASTAYGVWLLSSTFKCTQSSTSNSCVPLQNQLQLAISSFL